MIKKIFFLAILSSVCMTAMAKSPEILHIGKAEFQEKVWNYETDSTWNYRGKLPCIVDFYASWCGPCKRLSPILEELAVEYAGKIVIYKVNVSDERELAAAFSVSSIPMLLFCPVDGKPQMAKGFLPKETLKQAIDEVLLKK